MSDAVPRRAPDYRFSLHRNLFGQVSSIPGVSQVVRSLYASTKPNRQRRGARTCAIVAVVTCMADAGYCQNYFGGPGVQIPGQTFGQTWDMPHARLLGSAPNPTPDDLCVYGSMQQHCYTDATQKERRRFIPNPDWPGHYREIRPGDDKVIEEMIRAQQLTRQRFWPGGSG